jgi:hypothetical protein
MPVLASDFFMRLARALELTHNIASTPNSLEGLDSLLDPSLVEQALEQAGVATLRKRRLPLEMMLWCVISMAFFRRMSAWDVVSRMNIMLPGQRPLVAPSAVVQARQRLGSEADEVLGIEGQWNDRAHKIGFAQKHFLRDKPCAEFLLQFGLAAFAAVQNIHTKTEFTSTGDGLSNFA